MSFAKFLAGQLRKPNGRAGSVVGWIMNRTNRSVIDAALEHLDVRPDQHVLEIGFGGGTSLALLSDGVTRGKVTGIDLAPDMVRRAGQRFQAKIAEGRLSVQVGSVASLPFPDSTFDRVLTVNTVYFWPDTLQGFNEIRRVLKDGGVAAVGMRSKEKMEKRALTQHGFRLFAPEDVARLMEEAGFQKVQVDRRNAERAWDDVVVFGSR